MLGCGTYKCKIRAVLNRAVRRVSPAVTETALVLALFGLYNLGRLVAKGRLDTADGHARSLLDVEGALRLPSEAALQAWALGVPHLIDLADRYYLLHFPVTAGVLVWLWVRDRPHYLWARRALVLATGAAMLVHLWLPMTPPRLLAGLGMVDTGMVGGDSAYAGSPVSALANEYAAMPSLHVGWAVLLAVVLVRAGRTRWRWLWVLHPLMTLLVVVVTANHYWLDAAAGTALAIGSLAVAARWAVARQRSGGRRTVAGSPASGAVLGGR
jgi:hypothetical protein